MSARPVREASLVRLLRRNEDQEKVACSSRKPEKMSLGVERNQRDPWPVRGKALSFLETGFVVGDADAGPAFAIEPIAGDPRRRSRNEIRNGIRVAGAIERRRRREERIAHHDRERLSRHHVPLRAEFLRDERIEFAALLRPLDEIAPGQDRCSKQDRDRDDENRRGDFDGSRAPKDDGRRPQQDDRKQEPGRTSSTATSAPRR